MTPPPCYADPVPETMPRPLWRARLRRAVARGAALCAATAFAASLTLPAAALGEDGPFDFPAETTTVTMIPGAVTRVPLTALLEDDLEAEVDLESAQLAVPEDLDEAERQLMEVSDDSRSIGVAGEGTWTLISDALVFTPLPGTEGPATPIALTVEGDSGTRSQPATFTPEVVELEEISLRGSAGDVEKIPLDDSLPTDGSVRLELAGLPAGSTVTEDGSRATVPEQGVWQLSADGTTLTHTPAGTALGRQLDPVRLVAEDAEGGVVSAAEVVLTVPIISDLDRSAPFGEDIVFAVGEGQQHVDPATLRLTPPAGDTGVTTSDDGTEVVVPQQGTWSLDRESASVRFSPESEDVRVTAPMGIVGGDGKGAESATALLSTAYPILADRRAASAPGTALQFDLTLGNRDVRSDSLRFDQDALPEGAELSHDATQVRVDGEGTWSIDIEDRTVTMTPEEEFTGTASPVEVTARGVFADNPVSATFEAVFSPVIATMRDDEQRTAPQTSLTIDVLANDTAGSGSRPLTPSTLEIGSLEAINLSELEDGRGKRLVVPEEGTYTVSANGSVTFTPEDGFVGRTTPITYDVLDSAGTPTSAKLAVEVDPSLTGAAETGNQSTGINTLLAGLMPSAPATFLVFGTIVLLLLFGGGLALWIGVQMEADKRDWEN